ncbi:MAG: hypothetical protein ACYSTL_04310 [Planctomycetota bacterium]
MLSSGERLQVGDAKCVRVSTAYEAAAEILAATTAALVIDLRLLPERHLRLLEIARQRKTEILAVGSVPSGLTSENLSGVRLVSLADLPKAISDLPVPGERDVSLPTEPTPSGQPTPRSAQLGRYEAVTPSSSEAREQREVQGPTEMLSDADIAKLASTSRDSAAAKSTPKAPQDPKNPGPTTGSPPSQLLSPEELSALLETNREADQ